jgi:hypothetical protein
MRHLGHLLLLIFFCSSVQAVLVEPDFPPEGVMSQDFNHQMDPGLDYAHFIGRVTDKDDTGRIIKIRVENNNTKFFRVGDPVYFHIQEHKKSARCKGHVRNVEDYYFTLYVDNFLACWNKDQYFKRGTILVMESQVLADRVFEAMKFREILINKKKDFLAQLNQINNFLWNFDVEKSKKAAEFDAELLQMQKRRQKFLDDLTQSKQEQIRLQSELMQKLNEMDHQLKFYQIERQELMSDRWNMDHDAGLPVGHRPQKLKIR